MFFYIADFILIVHVLLIIFIVSFFFLIPIGYKLNWSFIKNRKIRYIHIILMLIVTLETFFGITCPLTYLENFFSKKTGNDTFIFYWISKIIYWDLPSSFFLLLYITCLGWTVIIWKLFPPKGVN